MSIRVILAKDAKKGQTIVATIHKGTQRPCDGKIEYVRPGTLFTVMTINGIAGVEFRSSDKIMVQQ